MTQGEGGQVKHQRHVTGPISGADQTVLVNSVWGQVPQRKLRQTLSSGQDKLTVAIPIASGPIICYVKCESRQRVIQALNQGRHAYL